MSQTAHRTRGSGRARRDRGAVALAMVVAAVLAASCGKKGPPLAPLHLVPDAVASVSVRRLGDDVQLRFVLPSKNLNGPGRIELDRVEIYAITLAPGSPAPANRELLSAKYAVGSVPVKPAPIEGEEPPPNAAEDTRPAPGGPATFVEHLTEDKLKPAAIVATTPVAPPAPPPPSAADAPPAPPVPTYPVRIYVIRGLTKGGRPGQPAARIRVPLVTPPAPPTSVTATFTEQAVVLAWVPPLPSTESPVTGFNIYSPDAATPLNGEPVAAPPYERPGLTYGTEQCFVTRTVANVAGVSIESQPADSVCVTPRDTFPPAAPKGLSPVAQPGSISLIWDANTEPDLAGYLVLRGEAPGDTLQPLTPSPIAGTSYEDKTVKPGVRYVYAIVAVDKATPPNTSAQSARVEETAR